MKSLTIFTILCVSVPFTTFSQLTNGLVAKYSFNNGDATDDIGTNNGNISGSVFLTPDRFGNADRAYKLTDTPGGNINFGDAPEFQFGDGNFSISIWFKKDVINFQGGLIGKLDLMAQNGYGIFCSDAGNPLTPGSLVSIAISESGGTRGASSDITDSLWHHAVLVHSYLDSSSLYMDNVLVSSDYTALSQGPNSMDIVGFDLILGKLPVGGNQFLGDADDIRIYDRVLTILEIDTLFNEANPILSVPSINEDQSIVIYPNPSTEILNITFDNSESYIESIDILSAEGQTVISLNGFNSQVDISTLSPGIYFIRLMDDSNRIIFRKFTKQ